jgi:hypothetical protein
LDIFFAESIAFERLHCHKLKVREFFHVVYNIKHLFGSLEPDFKYCIIAKFQRNGENILKNGFSLVDSGENIELMSDFEPDSPLFGILLKLQENIYQILSSCLFK